MRSFYDDLGGRCKPVNNEFRSQYDRDSRKVLALEIIGFIDNQKHPSRKWTTNQLKAIKPTTKTLTVEDFSTR